jgi:peptide methionine sulfoxide reductase msrA/msrB
VEKMKQIYLAGGCFWGVEKYLKLINGVVETEVGYANGQTIDPDYKQVCTGETGFAETVFILYDETILSLPYLIELFFEIIDPTSLNKQGNDIGTQYRTGIYYVDDNDYEIIKEKVVELSKNYSKDIVVEVQPLKNYYSAEEYHQEYLDKNPMGYCHIRPELYQIALKAKDPYLNK